MNSMDSSSFAGEYVGLTVTPKIEPGTNIFEACEQESDLLLRVRLLEAQISSWLEAAPLLQRLIGRCDALECHMGLKPSVESTKRRGRGRPRKVVVHVEEETDNDNIVASMRKHRCPDCGRVLSARSQLYRHMIHFHGALPYNCRICGKAFRKKNEVTIHRATVHAKPVRGPGRPRSKMGPTVLHCPEEGCKRTFTRPRQLREHINVCRGEKPFICDICGSRHARADCLRSHKRHRHGIGGGPLRAPCPVCGVVYVKSGMKLHLRTHTGEKPFVCTICGAAFTMRQALTTHERGHTGEKPFACMECGEKFKSAQTLKVHSYRHAGKPFECGVCGMRFTTTPARSRHMRRQHEQTKGKRGRGRPQRNIEAVQIMPHEPAANTVSSDQEGQNLK